MKIVFQLIPLRRNNEQPSTHYNHRKENWHDHEFFNGFEITWLGLVSQVSTDVLRSGFDSNCKETSSILLISGQMLSQELILLLLR